MDGFIRNVLKLNEKLIDLLIFEYDFSVCLATV